MIDLDRSERSIEMISKPKDYDTAASYDSDITRLPVGGYVCKVMKMEEAVAKTGTQMVIIYFDIAEGEYKDYYSQQYKRDKAASTDSKEVKWRGRYNLFPYTKDGFTNPSFKGALTCIEKSNAGFRYDWPLNFDVFKGKLIGLLFREEESVWDGRVITNVRPCAARPVDCIRNEEFTLPKKRELSDDDKRNAGITTTAQSYETQEYAGSFTEIETDELPF